MCTWLWDHLPEHEKPTNENTLKRGGCSLPQKLSTTNNTSESLEITFCVARILLSLILLMSWSGDHSWLWVHGCSHVLSRRHCTVPYLSSGSYILIFFLVLHWWPSPEHYRRVSVLIKFPQLVLYLGTFGVLWVHVSSGSYYCHSPRMHHWQPVLPPALRSCSI